MELINCTKHNDTYLQCKNIYTVTKCIETTSETISEEIFTIQTPTAFPDTIWDIPIIISIIIGTCIIVLLLGNITIRAYRSRLKNSKK